MRFVDECRVAVLSSIGIFILILTTPLEKAALMKLGNSISIEIITSK
jgi:hypothetical protein